MRITQRETEESTYWQLWGNLVDTVGMDLGNNIFFKTASEIDLG